MRWTPVKKFELIRTYRRGLYREVSEILAAHRISIEEFDSWLRRFECLGIDGLKITKTARAP